MIQVTTNNKIEKETHVINVRAISASRFIYLVPLISLILAQISRAEFCQFWISLYLSLYVVAISGKRANLIMHNLIIPRRTI